MNVSFSVFVFKALHLFPFDNKIQFRLNGVVLPVLMEEYRHFRPFSSLFAVSRPG